MPRDWAGTYRYRYKVNCWDSCCSPEVVETGCKEFVVARSYNYTSVGVRVSLGRATEVQRLGWDRQIKGCSVRAGLVMEY